MKEKLFDELAYTLLGKEGEHVFNVLIGKKDLNEFKIAERLGMTINQTRNLLYKLYAHDIVSFIRKKDKRKGWYIYFWTLNEKKALELLVRLKEKQAEQQHYLLKSRKTKRFFYCDGCSIEVSEENALQNNFLCLECHNLLSVQKNEEKVAEIEKGIRKLDKETENIKKELELMEQEENKKKEKLKAKFKKPIKKAKKTLKSKKKKTRTIKKKKITKHKFKKKKKKRR